VGDGLLRDAEGWLVAGFVAPLVLAETNPTPVFAVSSIVSLNFTISLTCDQDIEQSSGFPTAGWSGKLFWGGFLRRCNILAVHNLAGGPTITITGNRGELAQGESQGVSYTNPSGAVKGVNGLPLLAFTDFPVVAG